jgi:predicted transcriptional regulator
MLTIRVPPELVEALDAAALDRGGTRSNLIREALALVVHPCVVDAARARLAREKIRESSSSTCLRSAQSRRRQRFGIEHDQRDTNWRRCLPWLV